MNSNDKIKKRMYLIVNVALFAVATVAVYYLCNTEKVDTREGISIQMEQLKDSGEFQFDALKWGMSVDEVNVVLPEKAEENSRDTVYDKITQYFIKNRYELDGQKGDFFLMFNTGTLQQVQLSFNINEGYKEWFQLRVDEAKRLFGEESDTLELIDGPGGINSLGYRWDTSETTLQIVVMWGKTDESSVIISVAKKEE